MFQLQLVSPEHEAAVLAFERGNRAYFAKSISDRGDSFFERFSERHRELMAEQEAGTGAFYVLVDERGVVVGRFNLYDMVDGRLSSCRARLWPWCGDLRTARAVPDRAWEIRIADPHSSYEQ